MKLGAKPKEIKILGGLLAVLALVFYVNFTPDTPAPSPAPRAAAVPTPTAPVTRAKTAERARGTRRNVAQDWQPRLGPKNPEDRPDPATIDPTLHLDLLAKVQSAQAGAPGRNLFVFGAAPLPPEVKPLPKVEPIKIAKSQPPPVVPVGPPQPPPAPVAPQMTFKYYGYKISRVDGHKAAFLLDGEDILVAGENDTLKRRYRVVKIGVSSITIEDTQFKSTQTLALTEAPAV